MNPLPSTHKHVAHSAHTHPHTPRHTSIRAYSKYSEATFEDGSYKPERTENTQQTGGSLEGSLMFPTC